MAIDKDNQAPLDDDAPSPIRGLDWRAFHNYVLRALTGDEAVPAAVRAHVNSAYDRGERNLAERDREWWRDFMLRQAINDALAAIANDIGALEGMTDWYREQAGQMRQEMDQLGRRLSQRGEFIDKADSLIDGWAENGKLDRAKALGALRKRGVEVDERMTNAQLVLLLRQEHQRALEEQARDSQSYSDLDAGQQEFERQARELEEKARDYREERDGIINDPDLTEEERARRLEELQERIGEDVAYQAQEQERSQEVRESGRRESEASRDTDEAIEPTRGAFAAFKDTFNANSAGKETDAADQERSFGTDAPAGPGVSA